MHLATPAPGPQRPGWQRSGARRPPTAAARRRHTPPRPPAPARAAAGCQPLSARQVRRKHPRHHTRRHACASQRTTPRTPHRMPKWRNKSIKGTCCHPATALFIPLSCWAGSASARMPWSHLPNLAHTLGSPAMQALPSGPRRRRRDASPGAAAPPPPRRPHHRLHSQRRRPAAAAAARGPPRPPTHRRELLGRGRPAARRRVASLRQAGRAAGSWRHRSACIIQCTTLPERQSCVHCT